MWWWSVVIGCLLRTLLPAGGWEEVEEERETFDLDLRTPPPVPAPPRTIPQSSNTPEARTAEQTKRGTTVGRQRAGPDWKVTNRLHCPGAFWYLHACRNLGEHMETVTMAISTPTVLGQQCNLSTEDVRPVRRDAPPASVELLQLKEWIVAIGRRDLLESFQRQAQQRTTYLGQPGGLLRGRLQRKAPDPREETHSSPAKAEAPEKDPTQQPSGPPQLEPGSLLKTPRKRYGCFCGLFRKKGINSSSNSLESALRFQLLQ